MTDVTKNSVQEIVGGVTELPENIREKLAEAVELWADKELIGKPALLANCIYIALEKEFIRNINKVGEQFLDN